MNRDLRRGDQFHFLTVIGKIPRKKSARTLWICRCVCGEETTVTSDNLRKGRKKSCGCQRVALISAANPGDPVRRRQRSSYDAMLARCYNPKNPKYKYYGGRGVEVCERWRESFDAFCEDMGVRPEEMTLDRRDSHGKYEPNNCRWATVQEQNDNKRNTLYVTISGEREKLVDACRRLNLDANVVRVRLAQGWTEAEAFTPYVRPKKRKLTAAPR